MSALLQQPGFQKRISPLSVQTWHWLIAEGLAPKRSELLRGVIVEKMPKSIQHTKVASRIHLLVQQSLAARCWVRKEEPITTRDSEPEPDLSVVEGREVDYQRHPETARLVVEISVSSVAEDREMAAIYAEAGVDEYWIVNVPDRSIEMYRTPRDGRYADAATRRPGEVAECKALPEVRVEVRELFADLPA